LLPALLWGVALSNILRGVPIDGNMNYTGGFFNLLNGYALLGGLVSLVGFTLHGAIYLSLKTSGELAEKAHKAALGLWGPVLVALLAFISITYFVADILKKVEAPPVPALIIVIAAITAMLLSGYFLYRKWAGWAFAMTCLSIVAVTITLFMELYPRVMVSSTQPDFSLTIYNAASGHYTLTVISIVALIFLPVVLAYQVWSYWVFRKRVSEKAEDLHY
jgi:cytochrome d ubiquinol oxidase subunit II